MGFFMKGIYCILFTIIVIQAGFAQKTMDKVWSSRGIQTLKIDSDQVFNIFLVNSEDSNISAVIKVEGETYENVVLEVQENDGILSMETAYTPYFEPINDKLAAHKVLAIEMHVKVPSKLGVSIEAEIASLLAKGSFKMLDIQLARGNCELQDFRGNARIYTKEGFIEVGSRNKVAGKATSRNGRIINTLPKAGKYWIEAESISGDISLRQTQ